MDSTGAGRCLGERAEAGTYMMRWDGSGRKNLGGKEGGSIA